MSKVFKVDMSIDVSKLTVQSGMLMIPVPVTEDKRGYKERTGPQVFALICEAAINNANPKVSHEQLKAFRKILKDLKSACEKGEYIANKTDLEIIKNSIKLNPKWPNSDEALETIDQVVQQLVGAAIVDENPTAPAAEAKDLPGDPPAA